MTKRKDKRSGASDPASHDNESIAPEIPPEDYSNFRFKLDSSDSSSEDNNSDSLEAGFSAFLGRLLIELFAAVGESAKLADFSKYFIEYAEKKNYSDISYVKYKFNDALDRKYNVYYNNYLNWETSGVSTIPFDPERFEDKRSLEEVIESLINEYFDRKIFEDGPEGQNEVARETAPPELSEATKGQRLRLKGGRLVRTQVSIIPDLKAALQKAAAAENTSASLIINELLEKDPRIREYLDADVD